MKRRIASVVTLIAFLTTFVLSMPVGIASAAPADEVVFSPDNMLDVSVVDKDGNPIWGCVCRAYSIGLSISVVANSKKDAKKAAAYQVLIQHYGYPNEYGPSDRQSIWGYKNNHLVPEMEFVANKFKESKYEKILNDNK